METPLDPCTKRNRGLDRVSINCGDFKRVIAKRRGGVKIFILSESISLLSRALAAHVPSSQWNDMSGWIKIESAAAENRYAVRFTFLMDAQSADPKSYCHGFIKPRSPRDN